MLRLLATLLQVVAFLLVFSISGGPMIASELLEDDCADRCVDEEQDGCPDEGCGDCSFICSSCPRGHVVLPTVAGKLPAAQVATHKVTIDVAQRVPVGPPPDGVFHPPRRAG